MRQQQALVEANFKMRCLQEERDEAISKGNHFEKLFKSLSHEHEQLIEKFHELLESVQIKSLVS